MKLAIFLLILVSGLTVLSASEDKTPLREARSLIEDGEYAEATGILEAKKETVPGYLLDDIAYWLAFINYKQGRYSAAKRGLHEVVRVYTGEDMADDAMLLLGEIKMEQGETEKALVTYENLYRHYSSRDTAPEALYRIAEYYLSKGEDDKSIYLLNRIGSEYSQYAEYRQTSEIVERIEERRRQLEEAKKQDEPGQPVIETTPSPAREQLTDEERAERYVERLRFPTGEEKNRIYWFERVIEAGEKKLKEMEEGIEKARLRRYLSIGHQNKAIEEHRNGLIRSQMETLNRLINNYPESAVVMWARLQVNWCHMALGQYSMAVKGYREFIDTHPQIARNRRENAYFWYAYAQYHSGEKGAAAEAFKKYLHLFDNGIFDEWAKYWAARTFAELGDSSEAMAYLEQLKNDYPDTVFDISAIVEE